MSEIYKPPFNLPNTKDNILSTSQIRLLLMGPPKAGKTWSALTFPNPLVLDFDRGLTNYPNKVEYIPFWDEEFVKKELKNIGSVVNALSKFVADHCVKMTSDQTLIIDSLSTVADSLTVDLDKRTPISKKTGEPDGFWFWKNWGEWLRLFITKLTTLKCNVILICHEQEVRDSETGRLLSYKWILKGQEFSPRLSQFFTDVFRQTKITTVVDPVKKTVKEEYKWQVKADTLFPQCCTRLTTDNLYLPADYKSFGR